MAPLCAALYLAVFTAGCNVRPEGATRGTSGLVDFAPASGGALSTNLAVGSTFQIKASAAWPNDADKVAVGKFVSQSPAIIRVDRESASAGQITVLGPGKTELWLMLNDGTAFDRIELTAAPIAHLTLADMSLAGTVVDPRLPAAFATVFGDFNTVGVVARDRCLGPLAHEGLYTLESDHPEIVRVEQAEDGLFTLTARDVGTVELSLVPQSDAVHGVTFDVTSAARTSVTGARIAVAQAESYQAALWSRAFVGDLDVIGASAGWTTDSDAITLDTPRGASVVATVQAGPDGNLPADLIVAASLYEQTTTVDIAAANPTEAGRVAPDTLPVAGCGDGPCDPTLVAAGLFVLWLPARRRRALRERHAAHRG